jgi:hypothetical protein
MLNDFYFRSLLFGPVAEDVGNRRKGMFCLSAKGLRENRIDFDRGFSKQSSERVDQQTARGIKPAVIEKQ